MYETYHVDILGSDRRLSPGLRVQISDLDVRAWEGTLLDVKPTSDSPNRLVTVRIASGPWRGLLATAVLRSEPPHLMGTSAFLFETGNPPREI